MAHEVTVSFRAAEYVATDLVEDGQFVPFDYSGHVIFLGESDQFTETIWAPP